MKNTFITAALAAVLTLSAAPLALAADADNCGPCDIIGKTKEGWKWTKQVQDGTITVPADWTVDTGGRIVGPNGKALQKTTGAVLDGKPLNIFVGQSGSGKDAQLTVTNGAGRTYFADGKLTSEAIEDYSKLNDEGKKIFQGFAARQGIKFDERGNASWMDANNKSDLSAAAQDYVRKQAESAGAKRNSVEEPNMVAKDKTIQDVLTDHDSDIDSAKQRIMGAENRLNRHDDRLNDHDKRISANGNAIAGNSKNIGANTKAIGENKGRIDEAEGRIGANETHLKAHDEQIARNKSDIGANKILAKQQADDAENNAKGYTDNRLGDLGYTPKRDANGNIMLDANGKAIPADVPAQPKTVSASPFMSLAQTDGGNNGEVPETAGGGTPPADKPKATVKDYVDVQRAEAMQEVNQNIAAAGQKTLNTANAYADGVGARALQSANA